MTAPVFVDTNVFVYARQSREVQKQPLAAEWLNRLWREQLGRTNLQVLNECYVTLTRRIVPAPRPGDAWEYVRSLLAWNPLAIDAELLVRAYDPGSVHASAHPRRGRPKRASCAA